MTKQRAIVLLSAGLDSLTATANAVKEYDVVLALTFNYGQRAARQELKCARQIARYYKIKHKTIKLNFLQKITTTALVNKKREIPYLKEISQGNKKTAAAVWVPNRNGLFLNIAASFADSMGAEVLITGFNGEEAKTFPDNSLDYCLAAEKAFKFSTQRGLKIKNYFYKMDKTAIVKKALQLKAPLQYLWSCYYAGRQFCGACESCVRLANALQKNKVLTSLQQKQARYRGLK